MILCASANSAIPEAGAIGIPEAFRSSDV
jgi:hypothetical protein